MWSSPHDSGSKLAMRAAQGSKTPNYHSARRTCVLIHHAVAHIEHGGDTKQCAP